jgi:hypothetical protein
MRANGRQNGYTSKGDLPNLASAGSPRPRMGGAGCVRPGWGVSSRPAVSHLSWERRAGAADVDRERYHLAI